MADLSADSSESEGPSMPPLSKKRKGDEVQEKPKKPIKKIGRPKGSLNKKGSSKDVEKDEDKKSSYFSEFETVILCRAFVSTSEDPLTGNNQKGKDFWQTVTDKFNQLLTEEDNDDLYQRDRKMITIRNRFQRQVQPAVTKFNVFYKKAKTPLQSGKQEEDYINEAMAAYEEHYKIPFKFRDCLEHLWTMPKFDPMADAVEGDEFDEELNISNRDEPQVIIRDCFKDN